MNDSNLLMAGKRGLIMGVANERSLAWGIARATLRQRLRKREGCRKAEVGIAAHRDFCRAPLQADRRLSREQVRPELFRPAGRQTSRPIPLKNP